MPLLRRLQQIESYLRDLGVSEVADLRSVYDNAEFVTEIFHLLSIEDFQRFVGAAALTVMLEGVRLALSSQQRDELEILKQKEKLKALQQAMAAASYRSEFVWLCRA